MSSKKYSTCDNYAVIKSLGVGGYSKVKLAQDKETGKYVALKVLESKKLKSPEKVEKLYNNEHDAMSRVNHPNVMALLGASKSATYRKPDGANKKVKYLALEYLDRGEVFDYVYYPGGLPERIARRYFREMVSGVEAIHKAGMSHRDLKPENILLDHSYTLKIADLGFCMDLEGHDGSGMLKTRLGTDAYMAPEMYLRKAYSGQAIDLFACGIIGFILLSQNPPFQKADPLNDFFYKLIAKGRWDEFWKLHIRMKNGNKDFFSRSFRHLMSWMLTLNPAQRPTVEEVKNHPWFKGPVASDDELRAEMERRRLIIKEAKIREGETKANESTIIIEGEGNCESTDAATKKTSTDSDNVTTNIESRSVRRITSKILCMTDKIKKTGKKIEDVFITIKKPVTPATTDSAGSSPKNASRITSKRNSAKEMSTSSRSRSSAGSPLRNDLRNSLNNKKMPRKLETPSKLTTIVFKTEPRKVWRFLQEYCLKHSQNFLVSKHDYSMRAIFVKNMVQVEFSMEIIDLGNGQYGLDFKRTRGNTVAFYSFVKTFKSEVDTFCYA
mmetsp:Transcript_23398/g.26556  ORF Transcript_23398/g.26556 Transcript_23398/m.26556 type:complete len:554 (+) Transcript_23398:433-2094(+)